MKTIVVGLRAKVIRFFIKINIVYLAVNLLDNPLTGFKILKSVSRKRKTVQGLQPVKKFVMAGGRYFFSENIPGWPSSAFNAFFRNEISAIVSPLPRSTVSTVIFAITSRCRNRCGHCYEWNNISNNDWLTFENLLNTITVLKNYGINHIQLSGGEPLERFDDLVRLVRFASKNTDLWILTSGSGLTRERALLLKDAGLTGADISLDHWNADDHNRSRNNPDSFRWVREAARNCKEAGLATSLSLCAFSSFVTGENLEKYTSLAREWGIGIIRILDPREAGKLKGDEVKLSEVQVGLLQDLYLKMNNSDKFANWPVVTWPGYQQRLNGCSGAGRRYFYIDSKGEVHACPFCQRTAGNILTHKLEEIIPVLQGYGCEIYKINPS